MTFVHHLKESLVNYLTISEVTSELFANHSTSFNALFLQIVSLNDMVNDNLLNLGTRFEKLGEVLDQTEERMSSLSKDDFIWVLSGVVGFFMGSSAGFIRWIMFGKSHLNYTQGRHYWLSCNISTSNSASIQFGPLWTYFRRCIIRDISYNSMLPPSSADFHSL